MSSGRTTCTMTFTSCRTSFTLGTSTQAMFEYDFMINAFAASGIAAILAGTVGYFLVMRGQTFAGHGVDPLWTLSHIGFAGTTGSGLIVAALSYEGKGHSEAPRALSIAASYRVHLQTAFPIIGPFGQNTL